MLGDDVHRAAAPGHEQREHPPAVDVGSHGTQCLLHPMGGLPLRHREESKRLRWIRVRHRQRLSLRTEQFSQVERS
ncbi:hypothetical protein Ae168Ps1_3476 [Pseudonocardia sp. Ae168_Ps1]|nr:hypothetical protein Ae150APs1_3453 [Pseudonocardia sp. Ae150A_Ps1]OLL81070.1 hypothetical protein Ae168Ps1_3476 [Pseudonocardia sp. Ae168_Ps1]OLL84815.1 hypothetical protein Ae263Ps1_1870c [Pseudonocardia sp. Ae263_Ps1]OLL95168.1 hypothetical protein Ae356Ps1_5065 [Pseudonocardia sp. Ae356_Ps1]